MFPKEYTPAQHKEASVQLLSWISELEPEIDELEQIAEALAQAKIHAHMAKAHILAGWNNDYLL